MNYEEKFRVIPGSRVRLDKIDIAFKDKHYWSLDFDTLLTELHLNQMLQHR
jgi:hypothetical protein